MDEVHARVVERIRALAVARGLPESHVADRAGVSRSHYWAVMAGDRSPTLGWLVKIAKVLEVDVEALVARAGAGPGSTRARARRRAR